MVQRRGRECLNWVVAGALALKEWIQETMKLSEVEAMIPESILKSGRHEGLQN